MDRLTGQVRVWKSFDWAAMNRLHEKGFIHDPVPSGMWLEIEVGGESAEAWRTTMDNLVTRGLRRPELLIVDGGAGVESAIARLRDGVPA